jgi:hypothetical protein
MNTQFYTSNGFLTSYAFNCGYVERLEVNENNRKTMFKEHNTFHVNGFNNSSHFWESFDTLTEAKKYYLSIKFVTNEN